MEITTISNNEIKPPRRIINACNTCREPIYEGEPIYSSSRDKQTGKSGGLYGGAGGQVPLMSSQGGVGGGVYGGSFGSDTSGEVWAQCAWCYDQWQAEVQRAKWFWWRWRTIELGVDIIWVLIIDFFGWVPKFIDDHIPTEKKGQKWIPILFAIITALLFTIIMEIIGRFFFYPNVDRYKMRKRPAALKKQY